jgi:hypothetical protein
MADNDLESSPDRETNSRGQRIPKPDAVYVLSTHADDEFAARFVAGQEPIENSQVDARRGSDLGRGGNTLGLRRGLDKAAKEPAPEPTRSDLLHPRIGLLFERGGYRRLIGFVGDAEMFKTLPNAPGTRRWLPIELFLGESRSERLRGLVIGTQRNRKPSGPSRRESFLVGVHRPIITNTPGKRAWRTGEFIFKDIRCEGLGVGNQAPMFVREGGKVSRRKRIDPRVLDGYGARRAVVVVLAAGD